MTRPRLRAAALVVAVAALATACSSGGGTASDPSGATNARVTLSVFAAASLKKGFTEIAQDFEKSHPNVTVRTTFDGSSALVTQIKQGATADVIATADQKTMTSLGAEALDPRTFTRNVLTIITAPGNPKGITSVRDLARSGVTTVLCAPQVPCGTAAATVERNVGVAIRPASEETSVSGVVTKVTSGQADAGLVYTSDAEAAGSKVAVVSDPVFAAVVNEYPIATVKGTEHSTEAQQFVDLVTGSTGQQVLRELGFGAGR
ncbi:molybdate ABC transporter substrate-binding protein [Williamsia deligens]|uniref:Molybdate ABC transporter substrate-binding protein n=1 Tax=Williamsia deligens TaxID=321325 RepID=A0ABW3G3K5_9NOCA|nr:molybdate ABC transporter substrate-binding protein [Williamsia deligens]MCP2194023.1 molybdate transport system substrate-binding protein [Williamsia deligens]